MKNKIIVLCLLLFIVNTSNAGGNVPTRQEYAQALIQVLGSDGARFTQMVGALAAYCGTQENFNTGLSGRCEHLYNAALAGNKGVIKGVLGWLRPREVVQQSRTASQIISTQQANIATRISQIRAGMTNSFAGLNISSGGKTLPISTLAYLADTDSGTNHADFISPWGFFINGQISNGDYRYSDATAEGFDFDTTGITAGIDYRFSSKIVAGMAIGYANFDSTVEIGTHIDAQTTAFTFSAFSSFNPTENFYIDARASYGKPELTQKRSISFDLADIQTNLNSSAETQGTQKSVIVSSGYQFNANGWQLTPSLSLEYSKTDIDAYVETAATVWNVGLSEQNFKTNRYTLGIQANKSISLKNGVIIPSFNYDFINENQKGADILMRVSGMPAGEFFNSASSFNDDSYSSARLGLTFVSSNGKQAYIQYSKVFGWDGFARDTFSIGARFEF